MLWYEKFRTHMNLLTLDCGLLHDFVIRIYQSFYNSMNRQNSCKAKGKWLYSAVLNSS